MSRGGIEIMYLLLKRRKTKHDTNVLAKVDTKVLANVDTNVLAKVDNQ